MSKSTLSEPAKPLPPSAGAAPTSPAEAAPGKTPSGSATTAKPAAPAPKKVPEIGGPEGPEPTRYGDWERKGRCIDF